MVRKFSIQERQLSIIPDFPLPLAAGERAYTTSTFKSFNTDFHRVFKCHFSYGVQIILRGL
jgi:hypothetical protein